MKKYFFGFYGKISRIFPARFKAKMAKTPILSGVIRSLLNASVQDGMSVVTVTAGTLQGWQILSNVKREKNRWMGFYEPVLDSAIQ